MTTHSAPTRPSACLLLGDVIEQLKTLPAESVHTVVTSPPYWGLRDYGVDGQIGLEESPHAHIDRMVEVFREIRRVLRKDGTVWMNYGDCYATGAGKVGEHPGGGKQGERWASKQAFFGGSGVTGVGPMTQPNRLPQPGLKPKDLCMMPHRLAIALQDDGWWIRCDIVWSKPDPMPESIKDRPAKSHEYIFLMSKSERYFYDAEAVKEPVTGNTHSRGNGLNPKAMGTGVGWDYDKPNGKSRVKQNESFSAATAGMVSSRNRRSVWTIPTESYAEAHFATYPRDLVRPCILAGTSEKGCCSSCGAPLTRVIQAGSGFMYGKEARSTGRPDGADRRNPRGGQKEWDSYIPAVTLDWQPSCKCAADVVPCTVLDPFFGSGTSGCVALEYGRNIIGIEINPAYMELAKCRIAPYLAQGTMQF